VPSGGRGRRRAGRRAAAFLLVRGSVTPGAILPARELLGDLLLTTGRPADALAAYQASLARAPRRARSLQGAALAAERAGDRAAAGRWRAQYRALGARVDRGPRRPTPAS